MTTEPRRPSPEILDAALRMLSADGATAVFPVRGRSMTPTFPDGSEVVVSLDPGRIRFGDVVLFRQLGENVVHRLVGRRRDGVLLRGDGREDLDPLAPPDAVRGRVTACLRSDGWWSLEGAGARAYAVAVAVHDRFWSAAGAVSGTTAGDRARGWVGRLDRALLRRADAWVFPRLHARTQPPGRP